MTLTVLDASLPARYEWTEGVNDNWNLWIFEESASLYEEDIILMDDLYMALKVLRVQQFTWLDGEFHHYEVVTEEHEKLWSELDDLV